MIPTKNWDLIINRLRAGDTIPDACIAAQMTRMTLYRRIKIDFKFKQIFEEAIFYGNQKKAPLKKDIKPSPDKSKRIVLRKRR